MTSLPRLLRSKRARRWILSHVMTVARKIIKAGILLPLIVMGLLSLLRLRWLLPQISRGGPRRRIWRAEVVLLLTVILVEVLIGGWLVCRRLNFLKVLVGDIDLV